MSTPVSPPSLVGDTDVLSFLFNRDPIRGPRYAVHVQGRALVLPFVVVGEMLYGAEQRRWGAARRRQIEHFIQRFPIEYPNYSLCAIWAQLRAAARKAGHPIERQDAWIAAPALYLDLPLLTHNYRHYAHVPGLHVITEPDP